MEGSELLRIKKPSYPFLIILLLIGVILYGAFFYPKRSADDENDEVATAIQTIDLSLSDTTLYQAIFLTNGQVYFGKLTQRGDVFFRLEDVYYISQKQQTLNQPSTPESSVSLAKLGSEVHGPQDFMDINIEHIILIEDLKMESEVVKAIIKYKSNK